MSWKTLKRSRIESIIACYEANRNGAISSRIPEKTNWNQVEATWRSIKTGNGDEMKSRSLEIRRNP